jgi:hypothetical protein
MGREDSGKEKRVVEDICVTLCIYHYYHYYHYSFHSHVPSPPFPLGFISSEKMKEV